jgi:acyl-CoA-binding protein
MENTEFDFEKSTFEQIFDEALKIAKEYPSKADAFLQKYAEYILGAAADIDTKEDAIKRAKDNFGYHAARFGKETIDLMYTVYDCEHPRFGKKPYDLTPETIWQMAQEDAK